MVQQKKLDLVGKLVNLLDKNNNFVLIKLENPKHQSLENLRKELKKTKATFNVTKNTLFEKTINRLSSGRKNFAEIKKSFFPLKETSALLVLSENWSDGLRTFYNFIKTEKTLSFKFGILDGKTYKNTDLLNIAQLPGRDELMAKILGSFKSPTSRVVYAMKFNINKFVYILKQKAK